jgi:hypothetical protein
MPQVRQAGRKGDGVRMRRGIQIKGEQHCFQICISARAQTMRPVIDACVATAPALVG